MKRLITLLALCCAAAVLRAQSVGINTTPVASAALMVDTTATSGPKGMLIPRMTQARRNAISSPATGLMIYQTDATPGFYYYDGAAWSAVGGGGTTLPSQTGNAGKVLTTDGTNLSWGSGIGASYEVYATITTAQTTSVGSSLVLPDAVYFGANTSPASLTGGNTFSNVTVSSPNTASANASQTTSKFTAGTAGLYFVDIQLTDDATNGATGIPMLDFNGTGNSASSYYGTAYLNTTTLQTPRKTRGILQRLVYMNASDYFYIRLAPSSSVIGAEPQVDASNYIKIIKLR